ncbi:MAG: twin-arginine translocase TatA/TatE family subunit [Desulfurococcales archaeon]|nr:twin-arginine translocase TatA/TatE family subunit [Desulfurococcales archaeon]
MGSFLQGAEPLILILVVVLLLLGPKKLPELARAIGMSIREFKKGVSGGEEEN